MPCYDTNLLIHVCVLKDLDNCSMSVEGIMKGIIEEATNLNWLQTSLRPDQIISVPVEDKEREFEFKKSLILTVDSVLKKSTIFRKHVRVINTLSRILKVGDRIDLEITQHFKRGINLNLLNNIKVDELPSSSFLIIESFGDRRAIAIDKKNGLKYNGYGPIKIRYDLKVDIEFTCSETDKNKPIIVKREEKHLDFDDLGLGQDFYPSREEKFNLDFKDIQLGSRNTESRYELMLDDESELMPILDSIQDLSEMQLKSGIKNSLSEDDVMLDAKIKDSEGREKSISSALKELAADKLKVNVEDFTSEHEGNRSTWDFAEKYKDILEIDNDEEDEDDILDLD